MPQAKNSFIGNLEKKLLGLFKITTAPVVKVYNGYGNADACVVFGHVLRRSPLPRKRFRKNALVNLAAVLRLFMVKPWPRVTVKMSWEGQEFYSETETDGFFRFTWKPSTALRPGWYTLKVELAGDAAQPIAAFGKGQLFIPFKNQFAFISDIDDTFLVSHSSRLRQRLYVLLTKNAYSRKPFEGVVNHYQLLSLAHAPDQTTNPFFFVSSSEWNLYDYILNFSEKNGLPAGIYLLSQMKKLSEVFKTGQNKHATKFMRIARVLEAYPDQQFVLLGDDTQEDPYIYASVTEHFKDRIFAVYIRQVEKRNKAAVEQKIAEVSATGVFWCYFAHSAEAVLHSKSIGLIG